MNCLTADRWHWLTLSHWLMQKRTPVFVHARTHWCERIAVCSRETVNETGVCSRTQKLYPTLYTRLFSSRREKTLELKTTMCVFAVRLNVQMFLTFALLHFIWLLSIVSSLSGHCVTVNISFTTFHVKVCAPLVTVYNLMFHMCLFVRGNKRKHSVYCCDWGHLFSYKFLLLPLCGGLWH